MFQARGLFSWSRISYFELTVLTGKVNMWCSTVHVKLKGLEMLSCCQKGVYNKSAHGATKSSCLCYSVFCAVGVCVQFSSVVYL